MLPPDVSGLVAVGVVFLLGMVGGRVVAVAAERLPRLDPYLNPDALLGGEQGGWRAQLGRELKAFRPRRRMWETGRGTLGMWLDRVPIVGAVRVHLRNGRGNRYPGGDVAAEGVLGVLAAGL